MKIAARSIRDYPELPICFEFIIIVNLKECVLGLVVEEKKEKNHIRGVYRELKKQRLQQQRKRHLKINI